MATTQQKKNEKKSQSTEPADPGGTETLSGEPLVDLDDGAAKERPTGKDQRQAVEEAAATPSPTRLAESTQSAAMEWFLSPEGYSGETEVKTLRLNMGTDESPQWIEWKVAPVTMEFMRRIRREAMNTREARKTGSVDEYRTNLQVVAGGTVEPDLREAARILKEKDLIPSEDPADALRLRFQAKPGYIAQLSAQIMRLSGFDDEDVQEAQAITAAGNS